MVHIGDPGLMTSGRRAQGTVVVIACSATMLDRDGPCYLPRIDRWLGKESP